MRCYRPIFSSYLRVLLGVATLLCFAFVLPVRAADMPTGFSLKVREVSGAADFRGMDEAFRVQNDGLAVRFCFGRNSERPALFVIGTRALYEQTKRDISLFDLVDFTEPHRTLSAAFEITDWENNPAPKRDGVQIPLNKGETSRSLVTAPNSVAFLLGTDTFVRCYERTGKERWKTSAPGIAWGVNVSGDGKLAIAAFADGTIRWFRMDNGKELLAFFPHNDGKRWIVWTPSGYYDCSPGGETLIGWQGSRSSNGIADFYPVSQFRSTFYRPEVVSLVLRARSESLALSLAGGALSAPVAKVADLLPPVIAIVSPVSGAKASGTVTLRYTTRAPANAPVQTVRAFVDGRPAENSRAWVPGKTASAAGGEMSGEITVSVPERDCEVSLIATNKNAVSVPATLRVLWAGVTPEINTGEKQEAFVIKPKLYVLAVGVSQYANAIVKDLDYAAKDANDFAAVMQAQSGGLYREVVVKTLTDAGATQGEVLDGFEWIQRETTAKDVAMVLLSGHGANDPDGDFHFLTHDFDGERWKRTAVSFAQISSTLKNIKGKALFFVDSCHSGNALGTTKTRGGAVDIVRVVNELASAENGVVVFAASTGKQLALEDKEWNNGAFTKAVVEAINGGADYNKTGRITINMLDLYISERVKALTKGAQTPTTTKPATVADYPVAIKK